jgi:hypothetical protein
VIVGTIPPRAAPSSHNTNRVGYNTTIRGWVGTEIDAIFDIAADPTMGPDAAASDTSLYSDGTHPTAAGQVIFQGIYQPVIDSFLP